MSDNFLYKISHPKGKGKLWWAFIFITIITVGAFFVDFGGYYNQAVTKLSLNLPKVKEVPFRQGLDLQGGSRLLYQADVSRIAPVDLVAAVNGARDTIERRIDPYGISNPLVQVNQSANGDYRILVELAGIKNANEAINKIGATTLLEFKEQNLDAKGLSADQKTELEKFNSDAKKKAELILGKLLSGGDFTALAKSYTEDEKTKQNGGDMGWVTATEQPEVMGIVGKMKVGATSRDLQKLASGYELFKLEGQRLRQENGANAKEYKASHLLICYKGATKCESNFTKEEAKAKIDELKKQATPANFADLVKKNSTEPGSDKTGGDLGWFGSTEMVKPFVDAVAPMAKNTISNVVETEFGYHLILKQDERTITEYHVRHILVKTKTVEDILGPNDGWKNTSLSGKNLKRATVEFNPNDGAPEVGLEFDEEGAKLFEDITARNIGKPVAIYIDNLPISTPKVNEKISGGKAVINGKFTMQEAKKLVESLNSGALPIPIELINQQTIGASLGKESVAKSLQAGLFGLLLVMIFMILMYRLPGVLACASLIVYSLIVLAIFKLWSVTLTLSGIAGFIMSIGVAVDANVLIFERFKEELRNGKSLARALEDGFARAWTSVRDSNFTTIITCLVLIIFSTSVIKGFAVTLLLGVLVSLFTAVVVTRNFLKLIDERWLEKYSWLIYNAKKIKKQ